MTHADCPERFLAFAQKAFIVREGKLLLVRRSGNDPVNPFKWEVPGGRMKPGESVDEHIRREVFEEVGLQVVAGKPFFIWQWSVPLRDKNAVLDIVGVARICTGEHGEPTLDHQENDDYLDRVEWVDAGAILAYDLIPNMLPVAAAFRAMLETPNE